VPRASFGDSEIKEPDDLMRAVLKQKIGDRVRLKVRRGAEQLDIDVTLGSSS
jgi:S1-C subfamily serine protease